MEHVLRQCLIALRLAERMGLDEESRAAVYYTALLVNVGCHTDAHEQAKWFGDDIALKSGKYDHEFRSLRGAAASLRLLGSGSPPLHRFRVVVEFAVSGPPRARRDDRPARRPGPRARGAARIRRAGVRGSRLRLRAVGRARLAGQARRARRSRLRRGSRSSPSSSRSPTASAGVEAATALATTSQREAVRSRPRSAPLRRRGAIFEGLDAVAHLGRGDRRRAGARGRAHGRPVRRRPGGDRELRRPEVAVHARPLARRRRARRRSRRAARAPRRPGAHAPARRARPRLRAARRLERDLGQARAARRWASGSACGCTRT